VKQESEQFQHMPVVVTQLICKRLNNNFGSVLPSRFSIKGRKRKYVRHSCTKYGACHLCVCVCVCEREIQKEKAVENDPQDMMSKERRRY
jgi:hypothetical protein